MAPRYSPSSLFSSARHWSSATLVAPKHVVVAAVELLVTSITA